MENKNIDSFFKSRSHSFNEMPSDELWKKIENNLAQQPKNKPNQKKTFFTMGLPIIALITATALYLNNNNSAQKNETNATKDSLKKEIKNPIKDSNVLLQPVLKPIEKQKSVSTKSITTKNNPTQTFEKPTIQTTETIITHEKIYSLEEVHVKPEYPGSINKLYTFINKKFKTPKDCPEGRITLTFVIEKDGSLTDIQTVKDIGLGTGTEAIRVLKESSNWKPGKQDGKTVRVQYVLPISIQGTKNLDFSGSQDNSPVYSMAGINVQPEFIGGKEKLYEFINQNYRVPKECPTSKIYVSFIIEKDGSLTNIKIERWIQPNKEKVDEKINQLLSEEAIRVFKECPKWEPGEQNGKKVRVYNMLPITIIPTDG
jgi:hypothetical protein